MHGDCGHSETHFCISATCSEVTLPLVLRELDTLPSNSSPSLAIFNTTSLTNSPRYIPLIIFSKLHGTHRRGTTGLEVAQLHLCHDMLHFSGLSAFFYVCFPGLLEAASISLSNSVM